MTVDGTRTHLARAQTCITIYTTDGASHNCFVIQRNRAGLPLPSILWDGSTVGARPESVSTNNRRGDTSSWEFTWSAAIGCVPPYRLPRFQRVLRNARSVADFDSADRFLSAARTRERSSRAARASQSQRRAAGRSRHSQPETARWIDPLLLPDARRQGVADAADQTGRNLLILI